jgi:hypothetical protein|tara:strand:- start:2072 stop:2350 length:279 start_codon:yes stop_codon:yes gene_type:complete
VGKRTLTDSTNRYRVYKDVGRPPPRVGSRGVWSDLPLATIDVGDQIEILLDDVDARSRISAIRSFASRIGKKEGKKFSIQLTTYGIGIWRTI